MDDAVITRAILRHRRYADIPEHRAAISGRAHAHPNPHRPHPPCGCYRAAPDLRPQYQFPFAPHRLDISADLEMRHCKPIAPAKQLRSGARQYTLNSPMAGGTLARPLGSMSAKYRNSVVSFLAHGRVRDVRPPLSDTSRLRSFLTEG